MSIELYAQVRVRGYYRKDGTYVRPHIRSWPDGNPYNNYSFPGNYNPNTGKTSTGNPETYLKNYYKRNSYFSPSHSTRSTSSSYYPATKTSEYDIAPPTFPSVNSLLVALRNKINENIDYDINTQLLENLITTLQDLKKQILHRNANSHLGDNTAFKNFSSPSSSKQYHNYNKTYHIIIYSETSREHAEFRVKQIQSSYTFSGYQIKVLPAVVNGRQWYRVALGNFSTYAEAKEEFSLLSTSIPSDSWILKIEY